MAVTWANNILRRIKRRIAEPRLQRIVSRIEDMPLDPALHRELSRCLAFCGRPYAAHAALRSAAFLRHGETGQPEAVNKHLIRPEQIERMDHNQYFRHFSLSSKLTELSDKEPLSVLDVGGGEGQLAQFLPNQPYFLAEPSVNGLSSESLPFEKNTFDFVVCCHVLEHIPPDSRSEFVDRLVAIARRGVILLNPFSDKRTSESERLQLFIDVTNANWAHEHLDCTLPKLDFVIEYAARRNLKLSCEPNGSLPFSAAMVFANYFCDTLGRRSDFERINAFFNTRMIGLLNSAECPNSFLVTLEKTGATNPYP